MAKTRAIVQRRKAIRNIRKITRTMELIATARFKKAMDRASQAAPFTKKVAELAADLSRNAGDLAHPLLQTRPVRTSLLLVITSNRGLCGGYNASILREAIGRVRQLQGENVALQLEVSGKRGINYFRFQGVPAQKTYTHFEDKPRYEEAEELADRYLAAYTAGQIDRVEVAYMKFHSAARQAVAVETLLPLSAMAPAPAAGGAQLPVEYEFLPNAGDILAAVLPVAFKIRLFKCFLDAAVSEQIARRVAMTAATENAGDLIKELSRAYNRARQAQITKEIAEVIGGAAALE
jgi:F-type H+-transporting ATPase subunit gamma